MGRGGGKVSCVIGEGLQSLSVPRDFSFFTGAAAILGSHPCLLSAQSLCACPPSAVPSAVPSASPELTGSCRIQGGWLSLSENTEKVCPFLGPLPWPSSVTVLGGCRIQMCGPLGLLLAVSLAGVHAASALGSHC